MILNVDRLLVLSKVGVAGSRLGSGYLLYLGLIPLARFALLLGGISVSSGSSSCVSDVH